MSVSRRTRRAWSAFICGAIGLYGLWLDRQLQQTTYVRRTDCLADETWDERIACSFDKRASRNPANTYIRRRVESLNLSLISHPTSRPFFSHSFFLLFRLFRFFRYILQRYPHSRLVYVDIVQVFASASIKFSGYYAVIQLGVALRVVRLSACLSVLGDVSVKKRKVVSIQYTVHTT